MRCYNQLIWSNWSDPVALAKANSSDRGCNREPSSTAVYPSVRTVNIKVTSQTVQPSITPVLADGIYIYRYCAEYQSYYRVKLTKFFLSLRIPASGDHSFPCGSSATCGSSSLNRSDHCAGSH